MENDNFKLEPYQNQPLENLYNLKSLLNKVATETDGVSIWAIVTAAWYFADDIQVNLAWEKITDVIQAIEEAKFKAAELRHESIFDIVQCEYLAWEIMADVMTVDLIEKPISPTGDISWKTDYQDNDESENGGAK